MEKKYNSIELKLISERKFNITRPFLHSIKLLE